MWYLTVVLPVSHIYIYTHVYTYIHVCTHIYMRTYIVPDFGLQVVGSLKL